MISRRLLIVVAAAALGAATGYFVLHRGGGDDALAACSDSSVAGGTTAIGGPFSLTDATGNTVTDAQAITRPTLVYFGYSYCPDICPTDLARNAAAADLLADRGIDVGQVFITIDPDRDTPERMGEFSQLIHPDLLGLSGSPEAIAEAAKAYKVFYRRGEGEADTYLMDHSTFTYLMAPNHGLLTYFRPDAPPETVAEVTACFADVLQAGN